MMERIFFVCRMVFLALERQCSNARRKQQSENEIVVCPSGDHPGCLLGQMSGEEKARQQHDKLNKGRLADVLQARDCDQCGQFEQPTVTTMFALNWRGSSRWSAR